MKTLFEELSGRIDYNCNNIKTNRQAFLEGFKFMILTTEAVEKVYKYIDTRLDVLRKAGKYYAEGFDYSPEVYELLGVADKMNEVLGIINEGKKK